VRHRFDSLSRAPAIRAPLLALAGGRDTRIPAEHARRLVAEWGGPATLHVVPGGGHDDLGDHADFWPAVRAFLDEAPVLQPR
jgi:pimeloyl-ACP methyl ester carboxylesterase